VDVTKHRTQKVLASVVKVAGYSWRLLPMKWLEYISIAEAVVIRLGGLVLIAIFIGKAILHEFAR